MSLRPSSGPVGDPFLQRVRERHPDADLVLLPPEAPEGSTTRAAEPGAEEALAGDRAALAQAAGSWLLAGEVDTARGTSPGTVAVRLREVRHEPTSPLGRLAEIAEELGWRVRREPGPVERLVSTSADGLTFEASYAGTGTTVLQLTGPDRAVGAARARALAGGR